MFVDAIEKIKGYTKAIHTITREYGSDIVIHGAATLFFINENGEAITCKHVAFLLAQADQVNANFKSFKSERDALTGKGGKYRAKLRGLETKYGYKEGITVQIKNRFMGCVDKMSGVEIQLHPTCDLAIIKFKGFDKIIYTEYARLLKDSSMIKPGKFLCRLGFPFPEYSNFEYNKDSDDIEWTTEDGRGVTPYFSLEGMITRGLVDQTGNKIGIEMSTPGLKGQSGGALFDQNGIIYGMQSSTHHLHLGFDLKDKEIQEGSKTRKVSNYPFLHLGNCVHIDIIKEFLKANGIKFYEN